MKKYMFIFNFLLVLFTTHLYSMEKLVILGGGPAGLTAAIYAAQTNLSPLIIEGYECDGQLTNVYNIENYPGFPEGITGDELVDRIRQQGAKFGARFKSGDVASADLKHKPIRLTMDSGEEIYTESLIIALGTSKRWLDIPGEKELLGHGVSGSATCDAPLFKGQTVVVAGGSDAALEEALTLSAYASKVTIVHRSAKLSASPYLLEKIKENPKIEVVLNTAIEEVRGISKGHVRGVKLRNLSDNTTRIHKCQGVFVSVGRISNTSVIADQLTLTPAGLIAVDPVSNETSVKGVFAAGDVADSQYRKAVTAAASGCKAALDAQRFLQSKTP